MPDIVRPTTAGHGGPAIYLGIDPGVSGGMVFLMPGGAVHTYATPACPWEMWQAMVLYHSDENFQMFAAMELVTGWVGGYNKKEGDDGTRSNPGSSMLQLGRRVGWAEMMLAAAKVSHEVVSPRVWQKAVGVEVRDKGATSSQWKNVLKRRAVELYPDVKLTLKTCDAMLLAHYCKVKYGTDL